MAALAVAVAALALLASSGPPPAAHAGTGTLSQCSHTSGSFPIGTIEFTSPDNVYGVNDTIDIRVVLSGTSFAGDLPNVHILGHTKVRLETGETDRFADFATHDRYSDTVSYTYTVRAGDRADDLDYHSASALYWTIEHGGFTHRIQETDNAHVDCRLPAPKAQGSLSNQSNIRVDGVAPTADSVSSPNANGTYGVGSQIDVMVTFSEAVNVTGAPVLVLNASAGGRNAEYASGNGTSILTFNYTVQPGDGTANLDYVNASTSLSLSGGTIRDSARNAADLTLPEKGEAGSLGRASSIAIDAVAPAVVSVSSATPGGAYGIGSPVVVEVEFGENVTVDESGGRPSIALDAGAPVGRYAEYDAAASSARTLAFAYTVQEDDDTADLDYNATAVIALNGGTIRDDVGNDADRTLPNPAGDGLLDSGTIRLDGVRPRADSVSSPNVSRAYPAGSTIDVRVTFSEIVVVNNASGTPAMRLETGATDRNATFTGEGDNSTTLAFSYTVQSGDNTADLNYTSTAALSRNGGTIRDLAGNDAYTDLPSWGSGSTLGESNDIIIDTAPPAVLSAEAEFLDRIRVTFDGPVASGAASASAGWSVSGPSAENLSIAVRGPVPASAPLTDLVLELNASLPNTAPDMSLSYDASAGAIGDEAGNALQDVGGMGVADRIRPILAEALITGPREVTIEYTEPVTASQGAYSDLDIGGVARAIGPYDTAASLGRHVLGFAGAEAPVPEPPSNMTIDGSAVLDEANPPNPLGDGASTVDILDGRVLDVLSSRITGPDTVVIAYTRSAAAQQGDYTSLVVAGQPRSVTGLDGGGGSGTHVHTLTFSPSGAPPNATGSLEIDGAAVSSGPGMRLGNGSTIARMLADGQPPSVVGATAVSLDTIRVEFDEPVAAPGAAATGWSISGRDAAGLSVASSRDAATPSASLTLVLDGPLPDAAPDAITLSYHPAAGGSVEDAAGNGLVASSTSVADGIAPMILSAIVAGPNEAEIRYTEPVWADPGAYASVSLSSGGDPRPVSGLEGNGTTVHAVAFGGDPVGPGATGFLEASAAAVRDTALNELGGNGTIALADGQPPTVAGATAVSLDTIRVVFGEPVAAPGASAAGWSISGRDAAGLAVAASGLVGAAPSDLLVLTLSGPLPDTAPDATLAYDPAGGDIADSVGRGLVASSTSVADGIAPGIVSALVSGPNEAEIRYTEPVRAGPGAYASVALSSGGDPRPVSGLEGNGTSVHTVAFGGDPAGPGAIGSLETSAGAVRDTAMNELGGSGTIALADGQPPTVAGATAVSLDTIRVVFGEPVAAPGASAAGWSISGRDAAGLAVAASSLDGAAPSASLVLTLSGPLPDTAPDAVLNYDPAGGGATAGVEDAAGNGLAASSTSVADGVAPRILSANVSGPNEAEIRYTEPVWAGPGAYASVALSSGGDPRPVSGLEGNGTSVHTVAFGGDPAAQGTTGVLEMDAAAVRDAAMLPLGAGAAPLQIGPGGGEPQPQPGPGGGEPQPQPGPGGGEPQPQPGPGGGEPQPQPQPGNATARAVFAARNTVAITYSAALGPPAGHDGPVYASVAIDGEDGGMSRPVSGVAGLGTAVHTVSFGGDGVGGNQTGTIELAVGLEGAGEEGGSGSGDRLRFAAGTIPVASGLTIQTVLLAPAPQGQQQPPPVVIYPDGFTRAVDGTASGASARLAINVSELAGASAAAPGTVVFPAEAVTLAASFADVTFPPGATAAPIPAGGIIYLYAAAGAENAAAENAAAALDYPGAGRLALGTIVEVGGSEGEGAAPIVFDRPVRISLDGQAGGRAFYISGPDGPIRSIDLACAADDADRVHRQLGGDRECQIDAAGGDKVVYTYHLSLFGTAMPEDGAPPPPVVRECSMRLGLEDLRVDASPGGVSTTAVQGMDNSGSEAFDRVSLAATPWYIDPASDAPGPEAPSLPASLTVAREAGRAGEFALPAAGAEAVAQGLGGGLNTTLWFHLDLTAHGSVNGSQLVQRVTYTAECVAP